MKRLFLISLYIFILTSICSASTLTTNYSLSKPAAGDTDWATEINTNFDTIDTQMKTNADAIFSTTSIDTYSEINTIVADVTLTHNGLIDTYAELNTIVADQTLIHSGLIDTYAELNAIVADQTLTHNALIDTFAELDAIVADKSLVNMADGATWLGVHDFGGATSLEVPNSAAPTTDAAGEIAFDNNAWAAGRGAAQVFDGTANTYLVGTLVSDTPSNGQVPKWNTGGTITWEDDNNTSGVTIGDTQVAYATAADTLGGEAAFTYNATTNVLTVGSVETAATTAPALKLYDSDGTDADINGQIDGNLTDTGSGTEDFDMVLKQQIAGTLTAFLTADADGSVTIARLAATSASLTTPTVATSLTGSYLTASEMLITDGSKNIVSAPVATYPSLTELSYVKGVTSAIQTQLTAGKLEPICKTIETPTDADNFMVHRMDRAATITSINCIVNAATSAVVIVQECDANGANCAGIDGATAITCATTMTADDGTLSNAAVDSGDVIRYDIGTVTGTVGSVMICTNF